MLGKLKAELRAHVYAVLEKGESRTPSPLRDFLTTTSGRLVASLVRYTIVFVCPFLLHCGSVLEIQSCLKLQIRIRIL